jgi:hypothetical protein
MVISPPTAGCRKLTLPPFDPEIDRRPSPTLGKNEAPLQQLGLAFARHADDIQVGGAG